VSDADGRILAVLVAVLVLVGLAASFFVGAWLRQRRDPVPVAATEPAPQREPLRSATPAPEARSAPPGGRPRRAPPREPEPPAAAPETGTLRIDADVPGAQVFIDRIFVGTTPVTATDLSIGGHRLNVSAQGYEGYAETIDVEPGEREILVKFKEVRLDAAIEVVHKHRFGSCAGRLSATPRGIVYETDNQNDRFTAALLDLQEFEVDYLKKNLRIRPRGGRTYNFTDPDENADRLFVFHRDVEKARQRLAR